MRTYESERDRQINQRAERHSGGVTRREALASGLTDRQIDHRVRSGRWHAQRRGVYVVAGVPPTRRRALWAAVSAAEGACISGPTAAWLWDLPNAEFDVIHLLTEDPNHSRMPGVMGHRSRVIVPADRRSVDGLPVTSPARTIIDCSGPLELRRSLGWWIDHCLREGLMTISELQRCRGRLRPARGRSLRTIDAELERRHAGYQPGDSQPEIRLADWLEAAGLGRPLLGQTIELPGEATFFKPDGLYVAERVGYEYQSWAFHGAGQAEPFHSDPRRMNTLRKAGYDIYPFTSESTEAEVVEVIAAALARARR